MPRAATILILLAVLGGGLSACGEEESASQPVLQAPEAGSGGDDLLSETAPAEDPSEGGRARDDEDDSPEEAEEPGPEQPAGGDDAAEDDAAPKASKPKKVRPLTEDSKRKLDAVRDALRAFIRRVNDRDPSLCTELVTPHYLEVTTGRRGAAAVRKCRSDISGAEGPAARVNKIEGVRVEGRKALIQFTSSIGDLARRQIFRMVFVDGRWLIDGDGSAGAGG